MNLIKRNEEAVQIDLKKNEETGEMEIWAHCKGKSICFASICSDGTINRYLFDADETIIMQLMGFSLKDGSIEVI